MAARWVWPWKAKKEKFHTCGGPRRRPALAKAGSADFPKGWVYGCACSSHNLTRQYSFEIISYKLQVVGKQPIRPSPLGNSLQSCSIIIFITESFQHISNFSYFSRISHIPFISCQKNLGGNEWERASIRFLYIGFWVFSQPLGELVLLAAVHFGFLRSAGHLQFPRLFLPLKNPME